MRFDDQHDSPDVIDRRGERSQAGLGGGFFFLIPMLLRTRFGWDHSSHRRCLLWMDTVLRWRCRAELAPASGSRRARGNQSPDRAHRIRIVRARRHTRHVGSRIRDARQAISTREIGTVHRRDPTGCGYGQAATGPFYCPADERAYIDLGFYRQLEQRLGARGDFAQAYVIAHELGHHVQKLLGTSDKVQALRGNQEGAGGLSVRLELQADCYAGVWARSTAEPKLLDNGDIDEAIGATAAIGDNRLQRQAGGTVSPESWTHGSSEQRGRWFRRGYESGKMENCDTFKAQAL